MAAPSDAAAVDEGSLAGVDEGGLAYGAPEDGDPLLADLNATMDVLNDATSESTSLETLSLRGSVLPSLPQHRFAASSVLLIALVLIAVVLLYVAARRPTLRSRYALPPLEREWAPIRADEGAAAPTLQLPALQLPLWRGRPHRPSTLVALHC